MLYSIVAVLIIILDQGVKLLVTKIFTEGSETAIELIPGVLSLVRVQNDGAAFSFLAGGGARIWFIVLTVIFVGLVIAALATDFISGEFGRWCMVIVAAGGLSNCIDRVLYGYVVDMFRIDLFDFAVFNVADIFITVGCIAFIIYILFGGEKDRTPDEDEYDEPDDEAQDKPERKPLFKKKAKPVYDDEDEDEDDEDYDSDDEDDEEPVVKKKPSLKAKAKAKAAAAEVKPAPAPSRKKPRTPEEKVARARAAAAASTASAEAAASHKSAEDEAKAFEEFFRQRAEAKQSSVKTAAAKTNAEPARAARVPEKPVEVAYEEPAYTAEEPVYTPEEPVYKPVQKAPQPQSSSDRISSSADDDFDLDSILNEFK